MKAEPTEERATTSSTFSQTAAVWLVGVIIVIAIAGFLVSQAVAWWTSNAAGLATLGLVVLQVIVGGAVIAALAVTAAIAVREVWVKRGEALTARTSALRLDLAKSERAARLALALEAGPINVEGWLLGQGHAMSSVDLAALGLLFFLHDHARRVAKPMKSGGGKVWRAEVPITDLAEAWAVAGRRPVRAGRRMKDLLIERGALEKVPMAHGSFCRLAYPNSRAAVTALWPDAPVDWQAGRQPIGQTLLRPDLLRARLARA